MGTKQSQFDKATSPYSSWGSSIDNLICGPGRICGDRWTPISTRSNSVSSLRRIHDARIPRSRRRVQSNESYQASRHGQAEILTLNRKYSYDDDPTEVFSNQPLPSEIVSSTLKDIHVLRKESRRGSYSPKVYPAHSPISDSKRPWSYHSEEITQGRRTRNSLATMKGLTAPVNKKKKKAANRKSLPAQPPQPIQIFIDLNGTQQQVKLDSNNRANVRLISAQEGRKKTKRTKKLARSSSPERVRHLSKQSAALKPLEASYLGKSVPDLRNPNISHFPKKRKFKQSEPKPFSKSNSSATASSNSTLSTRRVIPPRDKQYETPPQPFRIKSVPDKPFTRISSGKTDPKHP